VVIDYFYVFGPGSSPGEANSPLIIHPDAVLALPVSRKGLQSIARRNAQVMQEVGRVNHQKFAMRTSLNLVRQLRGSLAQPDVLGFGVRERNDHV
jgi:hypothetical protein